MRENQNVIGFGRRLNEQRELRKVSLEEISTATKISKHLLHAMENDQWERLPGGIFTRNFIRLYAAHLGLDAERWVDDFKHFQKLLFKKREEEETVGRESASGLELPRAWMYAILGMIVVLLIGGFLIISYVMKGMNREQRPPETPIQENTSSAAPQEPGGNAWDQQAAPMTVALRETTSERCWYLLWTDGKLQTPGTGSSLLLGEELTVTAESSVRLMIAHIEGVELRINGKVYDWEDLSPEPHYNDEGRIDSYIVTISADAFQKPD